MKRCPQCGQTYNDGSLNFCLLDGAALVGTDSEETVVIPQVVPIDPETATVSSDHSGGSTTPSVPIESIGAATPPIQEGSQGRTHPLAGGELRIDTPSGQEVRLGGNSILKWLLIFVGVIFLLLIGAGLAGFFVYYYTGSKGDGNVYQKGVVNTSASPKPSPTPKASPSPSPSPTPGEEANKATGDDDDGDEVTPILWSTGAVGFKDDVGTKYTFKCPPDGVAGSVWGNDIYAADSSVCTAAVHAGEITLEDGGEVTIEFRPGRSIYGGSTRNGITSNTFGEYPKSFVFK